MKRAPEQLLARVPPVREALARQGHPLDARQRTMFESQVSPSRMSAAPGPNPAITSQDDAAEREASAATPRDPRGAATADFSRVRVHTGGAATDAARALGARAFTVGDDIVFGGGELAPHRDSGRRLLAHELLHTTQPGSERRIARDTVGGIETEPVDITRAQVEAVVRGTYWDQKVGAEFDIRFINSVEQRFKADAEERDATLAALWSRRPTGPLTSESTVTVSIPKRAGQPKSEPLLYEFIFQPSPTKGALPLVKINLAEVGAGAVVSPAPAPPSGYTPPPLPRGAAGFPEGIDKYWKAHPEEHKQLYRWIEQQPGPKISQVVTTSEGTGVRKHDSSFKVTADREKKTQTLSNLEIKLLGETPIFIENPPPGYQAKNRADLELEAPQGPKKETVGTITGLDTAPADEQPSVKYVIWQYFQAGTRNKEVDVRIPVAGKPGVNVYYTLTFSAGNKVTVARVGEEGSSPKLTAQALNITRVEGFAQNATDPAAFKKWVAKRYPGVTPQGATLPELQDSVNKSMSAAAGTPEWFRKNYAIEILDPTAAKTRLESVHGLNPLETADLKDFNSSELQLLEFGLETMSDAELALLKGTQMSRQKVLLKIVGKLVTPDTETGGITRTRGSDKTITIFDIARAASQLFAGGAAGVRPSEVRLYVHEMGHLIGGQAGVEAAFKAFVAKKKIQPITAYAGRKPATETFPEAFAVFQTDPEWMQANLPELFTWLDDVKKTGKPPVTP